MFSDFNKFATSYKNNKNLQYIKCKDCTRKETCDKVEKYKNNTYQPKNNLYYWEDYGCYQARIEGKDVYNE